MPYSHHSHSGQFCPGHARDSLEQMVQTALAQQMRVFAFSEHMPRHDVDQYPEEKETGCDLSWHYTNERAYFAEAQRLRQKYQHDIGMLIGFESDWIRPESQVLIERSIQEHPYDFFIGSVHHVHTIPIDYDAAMYGAARDVAGGTDEALFADYFDAQYEMLQALKPPIVGHFDLIRLKSEAPDGSFRRMDQVWFKIQRNLEFIAAYGGILEINCASLRKGMVEPYPKQEICQMFRALGGRFCLSDDSHATDQIALNYDKAPPFLREAGIVSLCYLRRADAPTTVLDERFPLLELCETNVDQLLEDPFWKKLR